MKLDIILAGVGGQGILSIAAAIGSAALKNNLYMKQSEVHGMSQRGGAVQAHLRISDSPIASDLIALNSAHCIISVEPMESLRYLPYLKSDGWIITNTTPFVNIPNYPDIQVLMSEIKSIPNTIAIDAEEIAKSIGSSRSSNMVILGAASLFMPIAFEHLEDAVKEIFSNKGKSVIDLNIEALQKGRESAKN